MADTAEIVPEVQVAEKEVEKKVVDVEAEEKNEEDHELENGTTKENGSGENGEKELNGDSVEVVATKRKSGAGDATDGTTTPTDGATPEKKAKICTEEKETESDSRNGESEVAA